MRWDRGVDGARFSPVARAAKSADEPLNVLYAGRITREKGVDLLAEAFRWRTSATPACSLMLAGGGPERERVAELLGARASFLGWLEGELSRSLRERRHVPVPSSPTRSGRSSSRRSRAASRSSPLPPAGRSR